MRIVTFHPLARLVLEPRQRPFPARCPARVDRRRPRRSKPTTRGRLEPRQPPARPGAGGLDAYRAGHPELSSRTYARAEEAVERGRGRRPRRRPRVERPRPHRRPRARAQELPVRHASVPRHPSPARSARPRDGRLRSLRLRRRPRLRRGTRPGLPARGWDGRAYVWHEAADTRLFRRPGGGRARRPRLDRQLGRRRAHGRARDLPVRSRAGRRLGPRHLRRPLSRRGAGDPGTPRRALSRLGAECRRARAVRTSARHARFTSRAASTSRLCPASRRSACSRRWPAAFPLASAPWEDAEGLFTPGEDYLVARDGAEMERHLRALAHDPDLRRALTAHGLATIRARHTCRHRAAELLAIAASLAAPDAAPPASGGRHEPYRVLRLLAALRVLEWRGHLLSRPAARPRPGAATASPSTTRRLRPQSHRDIEPPIGPSWWSIRPPKRRCARSWRGLGRTSSSRRAASAVYRR